jgi:porphobilinogen synthase
MQARGINDVTDFLAESIGNLIKAVVFLLAKTGFCHHCAPMNLHLLRRPRRLRRTDNIRRMVRETHLIASNLIWPLFVQDGAENTAIDSMPGVFRNSVESLVQCCQEAEMLGIPAVAIFPSIGPSLKDPAGSHGLVPDNLLYRAVRAVKAKCPDLVVITDVALDPYTSHGHDGLLSPDGLTVDNDSTVEVLCRLAILEAEAGADMVAPSDMMDGRVGAIRGALDAAGFTDVAIVAYSAKFASALYGPFRDAVGSKIGKDAISKATYQLDPANRREACLEVDIDISESADIVMVKPASYYLDIIREVSDMSTVPVAAYQVSGEYSQIQAAAKLGWLDYERTRNESLVAIKRAGADLILTYFAREVAEEISLGRFCQ